MGNRKRKRPGPQDHAEGAHGDKTHEQIIQELESGPQESPRGARPEDLWLRPGAHRLLEDRTQHDVADLESDKSRRRDLVKDEERRERREERGG
jgi:hypothetical protein